LSDSFFIGSGKATGDGGAEFFRSPSYDHAECRSEISAPFRIGAENGGFAACNPIPQAAELGPFEVAPVKTDDPQVAGVGSSLCPPPPIAAHPEQ
jgi:hypothetical protein